MDRKTLSKHIDRDIIEELKNNTQSFASFVQNKKESAIIYALEKLGRLSNDCAKEPLLNLLDSNNERIRALSVKNLAKFSDISLLSIFAHYARNDESTAVRREAVSAIGRLRHEQAIPILIQLLADSDPKIVMQTIRGLLVFANNPDVKQKLTPLLNHPNELIQQVIHTEMNGKHHTSTHAPNHAECPHFLKNRVIFGDVREILRYIPDESVHLTFTSPPYYNARDYSIYQSYSEYLHFLQQVFKEVHRVTKEGRFFALNTSPIIIPRISRAHSSKRYPIPYDIHPLLVNMGWEFIDDIVWIKPEASVKNRNAGFLQHRKPLAYKPNAISEMVMIYRKKTDTLIDWNIRQYSRETVEKSKVTHEYETTNVWHIDPTFDKVHSAVFPQELCNKIITYYSFVNDLIFDPFAGSGTVGRAALSLNRHFLLTEKEPQYINRMKEYFMKNTELFHGAHEHIEFIDVQNLASLSERTT